MERDLYDRKNKYQRFPLPCAARSRCPDCPKPARPNQKRAQTRATTHPTGKPRHSPPVPVQAPPLAERVAGRSRRALRCWNVPSGLMSAWVCRFGVNVRRCKQTRYQGCIKKPICATANSHPLSEKRRAKSRLLILPRSFVGIEPTIKIRFGTCHGLRELRQNRNRSFSVVSGVACTHAATSSFRNPAPVERPNTIACRTLSQRSNCASISAGFTFFPATLMTSETRPTIVSAELF